MNETNEKNMSWDMCNKIGTKIIFSLSLMITILKPDYIMTKNTQKKIAYNTSLGYNLFRHYYLGSNWWNYVEDNIILGAIPLKNYNHDILLAQEGVDVVISLIEPHEYDQTYFSDPVLKSDWENCGIEHVSFPTADFNAIEPQLLDSIVKYMFDCITMNRKMYVHCKAGKGRSAIVVICFLLKYCCLDKTPEDVIGYVKTKREIISMNSDQLMAIDEFYSRHMIPIDDLTFCACDDDEICCDHID